MEKCVRFVKCPLRSDDGITESWLVTSHRNYNRNNARGCLGCSPIAGKNPGREGRYHVRPIRGRVARYGMIFNLSALNGVYNFKQDCSKQALETS